jgi:exodeoxyribonuclease VII large subunit
VSPAILSVSEFSALVNQTLEFAYQEVVVEGEISEFSLRKERFVFFDLKDAEASLNCFMMVYQLKTPLEDGMKVRVTATPKLTTWGKFSLTVRQVELAGAGELKRAYELLKQKLEAEGLFAPERKRELPEYPQTIGVVSSAESAGFKDFCKILNQRWSGVKVQLADVQVQGEAAPAQVVNAIEHFNLEATPPQLLVIMRGGGSLEDLSAFSTEPVVRAIAASRIPTVVGVGHEQDISLADLAADVRAATPTDAARRVVPDKHEVARHLGRDIYQIEGSMSKAIDAQQVVISRNLQRLEQYIELPKVRVSNLALALEHSVGDILNRQRGQFAGLARTLAGMDPRQVLKRGYAIARKGTRVVRAARDVSVGDLLMLQLAEDVIKTEVKDA